MGSEDIWKLFLGIGSIEGYLLYKMIERQELADGGDKNQGFNTKL